MWTDVDVVISVVLGVLVVMLLAAWISLNLGVGEQFFQPLVAFLGYPVIWLVRRIEARRRERRIRKLPPNIPPPPPSP
jgi:hypothetical protein